MNFHKLLFISFLSAIILSSCNSTSIEKGIGYTEYIESQELVKQVVQSHDNGNDMAAVYMVKGDEIGAVVKEVHYFEDGTIQVEGTLKDTKRHGVWTFYHKNGKVWSTGEFEDGKSVGCFEIYEPNGDLKIKSYYQDNKKVKEEYYKDNKLDKTVDL